MKGPTPMGKAAPSLLDLARSEARPHGPGPCAIVRAVRQHPTMASQLTDLLAQVLAYEVTAPQASRGCDQARKLGIAPGLHISGQVFQRHRERACAFCAAEGLPIAAQVAA